MNKPSDNTPAKPSKRPVGRPKGRRDSQPRKRAKPVLWTFSWQGKLLKFTQEISVFRRVFISLVLGGRWFRGEH